MGKTNRFRRLKELGQMTAKVKQQRYDEGLLGDGVCAALSMQWLQQNGKLDASAIDKSIKGIAEIQRTFESIVKTEGTIKAVEVLARAMGLRFVAPPSYCLPNQQPSQFWSDQGYGTNFSNQIVAFARTLHAGLEPDSMQAAFLSVKLVTVSFNDIPREILLERAAAEKLAEVPPLDFGHALALIIVKQGIILCDANCGIYQIEWDKAKPFFDHYQECYTNFANKVGDEDLVILEPQLRGIFRIGVQA